LYTSKTQHLDEGHISKSIKQVYASMWNFRAYEERDFYRVNHFIAAMGVLCHPNFEEEQSNGVGISIDPIYETDSTYYLNTQVGESLITNPDENAVPEEILLYQNPSEAGGYLVLRLSNLVEPGELVMDQEYLDQMRDFLGIIHEEFAILYDVVGAEGFGMDIEYKVTAQDQMVIKQARPWVSFWADIKANNDLGVTAIVEPQSSSGLGSEELVTATIANQGLNDMHDFEIELVVDDETMETILITDTIHPFSEADFQFTMPQDFSAIGDYIITGIVTDPDDEYGNNDTLNVVLSKVHELNGELSIGNPTVTCNDVVEVNAMIMNLGETTITEVEIEVVVNDLVIDVVNATVEIAFQAQGSVEITIDENLDQIDNDITFNLLSVNNQADEDPSDNSASTSTTLDSDYDIITFIINADNYPQETSWDVYDEGMNEIIASGSLEGGTVILSEEICLNYGSCFTVTVYDSYGDGICCAYGLGDFLVQNSSGETIATNDGEFEYDASELICPDGTGCEINADLSLSNTTNSSSNDGAITIYTSSGNSPFQYSIDGGDTFFESNSFTGLAPGNYEVIVEGSAGMCSYEETVIIEACTFNSVEIASSNVSSSISANGSIEITPTSGVGPYQYSIDGGQNFVSTNIFPDLAVGTYNVIVHDASGVCPFEIGVPIIVDEEVSVEDPHDFLSNGITIYPNPTDNIFNIELDSYSSERVNIEVYDHLGRSIQSSYIAKDGSRKTTISLDGYGSGAYLVRCYTSKSQKCFKVVKI
ncbi:MAG: hypothetical protein ACI84C_002922, partial [Flavobacteriales bacterium]